MSDPRGALTPQSGVTLVETLVALFVIALMATAGAVMTGQALRGARAVEARGAEAGGMATALGMISSDLAAYSGHASQDAAMIEPATAFEGHAPRFDGRLMVFVRNGWENPAGLPRSDLQRVEYLMKDGALIRRSWAAPDPGPGTRMVEDTLLSGLERVEARFGRGDAWQSEWLVSGSKDGSAPQKVELRFTFAAEDVLTARYLLGAGT